jgi:hypothetical protein
VWLPGKANSAKAGRGVACVEDIGRLIEHSEESFMTD